MSAGMTDSFTAHWRPCTDPQKFSSQKSQLPERLKDARKMFPCTFGTTSHHRFSCVCGFGRLSIEHRGTDLQDPCLGDCEFDDVVIFDLRHSHQATVEALLPKSCYKWASVAMFC